MNIKFLFVLVSVFVFAGLSFSQQWVNYYNGPGNSDDQVKAVCSDDSGNVYVTGFSVGAGGDYDIVTIKYNFRGTAQWIKSYDGSANGEDRGFGIAIDGSGYIYVAGFTTSNGNNEEDFILIKYNAGGNQDWVRTFNGGSGYSDKAWGISIDDNATDLTHYAVYLTGCSENNNNADYRTVKYLSDGSFQWSRTYNGGANDQAWGIIVDDVGNIGVTGFSELTSSSYDYYTIVYTSDGTVDWAKRYNGPANMEDRAMGIVVDNEHNFTVTGYSKGGSEPGYDITTIQYDKNGIVRWTNTFNGQSNLDERPFGIVMDNAHNIIITGFTTNNETAGDLLTISYSKTGNLRWTSTYNVSSNSNDVGYDAAVSANGEVIYVAGASTLNGAEKPVVIKYSSTGGILQAITYPSGGRASCVNLSSQNNLFVGGYANNELIDGDQDNDFITMEFEGGLISLSGISESGTIPNQYRLMQNYPNPFNPSTVIKFSIPEASYVEIKVFDMLGREIDLLVGQNVKAGQYEVNFDASMLPSGIYFYKMITKNFTDSRKMVLVK